MLERWPAAAVLFVSVVAMRGWMRKEARLLGQAGRLAGDGLGPGHVVVPAGDDSLSEQAAARLDVGDQVPAAVGVGGQVPDGVEQPQPLLCADVAAAAHVLLDVGP